MFNRISVYIWPPNSTDIKLYGWGTRWRSWLRYCATSRKVAGSIPDAVIGIFYCHNPSGRIMTLRLTQPLTEMSTRNIFWGVMAAGSWGWPYHLHVPSVLKSGSLRLLEPSGPVQACNGIALPFKFLRLQDTNCLRFQTRPVRVKLLTLTLFHGSVSIVEVVTCRTIWELHCAQGTLTEETVTYRKTITGSNKKIHIPQALTCPEYIIELICWSVTVQALLTVVQLRKRQVIPSNIHTHRHGRAQHNPNLVYREHSYVLCLTFIWRSWVRASQTYFQVQPTRRNVIQFIYILWNALYVSCVPPLIIRSSKLYVQYRELCQTFTATCYCRGSVWTREFQLFHDINNGRRNRLKHAEHFTKNKETV